HLAHQGLHLPEGFRGASVDAEGLLLGVRTAPGRSREHPQDALRALVAGLFGDEARVSGRGEARRAVRALLARWRPSVAAVSADDAVAQILDAAPFLWEPAFGDARRSLAARDEGTAEPHLWVAGPGRFRDRLLAGRGDLEHLEAALAGPAAAEL